MIDCPRYLVIYFYGGRSIYADTFCMALKEQKRLRSIGQTDARILTAW